MHLKPKIFQIFCRSPEIPIMNEITASASVLQERVCQAVEAAIQNECSDEEYLEMQNEVTDEEYVEVANRFDKFLSTTYLLNLF